MHYTKEDLAAAKSEATKKTVFSWLYLALLVGGVVTFAILRWQTACSAWVLILGCAGIFLGCTYVLPSLRYNKYLREMMASTRSHIRTGTFTLLEEDESTYEKLPVHALILTDEEGEPHRFYLDVQKSLPEHIQKGDRLTLVTFGQSVKEIQ